MYLSNYFIPIVCCTFTDYNINKKIRKSKHGIRDYIDLEADRIKEKGCSVILIKCDDVKKNDPQKVMLVRKHQDNDRFKLKHGYMNIRDQYNSIIKILEKESTKVIKVY